MLSDEIKQFFHGDVSSDDATLTKYSRDYSIFKVRPQVVVFPRDVDDVKNLVKFVSQKKQLAKIFPSPDVPLAPT
jgi:FAD/FMN-containing dehydrogenase